MEFDLDDDAVPDTNAVVKVFTIHSDPNYALPWSTKAQSSSTSTGFAIRGPKGQKWLLTNAHSVENHAVVQVRRRGGEEKFVAEVLCEGPDCDLALLSVEDKRFWEGLKPLSFSKEPPRLREEVTTLGYPIGGDSFCVTKGVVSRMDLTPYSHGAYRLLALQIDAAINPGNSGGPVVRSDDSCCLGIAFQSLKDGQTENIGYVIPAEIAQHFIQQYVRFGKYTGFGYVGFSYQRLENPTLRSAIKMPKGESGVMVKKIDKIAPAFNVLKTGDIICKVLGKSIANDGTLPFLDGERINFNHEVQRRYVGEKVAFNILRDGKTKKVEVETMLKSPMVPLAVPRRPEYLIVGGIVFVPLTAPFLRCEYGEEYELDAPVRLVHHLQTGEREKPGQQVVLVSQILASQLTIGYTELKNIQVCKFNGEPVHNLNELAKQVKKCTSEYLRFELVDHDQLILNTKEAKAALAEILKKNMISSPMSEGLGA
jgi:S1-C subfamily serine protease